MSEPKMITASIVISLIAGVLIILGSIYSRGFGILGVVSGIVVLISAIMLKIRPGEGQRGLLTCCRMWGALIQVFSIVCLFGGSMDGIIGAILGIFGGAIALIHPLVDLRYRNLQSI